MSVHLPVNFPFETHSQPLPILHLGVGRVAKADRLSYLPSTLPPETTKPGIIGPTGKSNVISLSAGHVADGFGEGSSVEAHAHLAPRLEE